MAREPLKIVGFSAVALILGLALGGLPARGEVRSLRQRVTELEERPCDGGAGLGQEIARAFRGPSWSPPTEAEPTDEPTGEPTPDVDAELDPALDGPGPAAPGEVTSGPSDEDLGEGLDMARDAMELRQRLAFAALEDQAEASDEQMAEIEQAVDDMNTDLLTIAHDFVALVQTGAPERRDAMVFAADTLDVLIEADERIYETLTPEQREALDDEALDPMAYVDASIVDAFVQLEGAQ